MEASMAVEGAARERREQGWLRVLACAAVVAVAADAALWDRLPGIGWGLFFVILLGCILASRERLHFRGWHALAGSLFIVSALQTGRFVGLANWVTLWALLFVFAGDTWHRGVGAVWRRWFEGALAYARPLGVLLALTDLKPPAHNPRIGRALRIALPVTAVVLLFSVLLQAGNLFLGNFAARIGEWLARVLHDLVSLSPDEFLFVGFVTAGALPLIVPPMATRIGARVEGRWRDVPAPDERIRLLQWQWGLVLLNLVFLTPNVVDVVFLWFGQSLPPGVNHSEYVHQGVYALIGTTVLSAAFMALLTQHPAAIRHDRVVRWTCGAWLVQNVFLIAGVWLRLWLYVDGYGYTMKRVGVALFLAVVMVGYALLAFTLLKDKGLKWLVGANLTWVFAFFAVLQFMNVQGWVARRDLALYQSGRWSFSDDREFIDSLGSSAIPLLVGIHESPRSPDDAVLARLWLNTTVGPKGRWDRLEAHTRGLSYQSRAANNWKLYQHWKSEHPDPR